MQEVYIESPLKQLSKGKPSFILRVGEVVAGATAAAILLGKMHFGVKYIFMRYECA